MDSQPRRRPWPHSAASTTRSRVCRGLTFSQPAPRRPASYGGVQRLDHHALVAGGQRRGQRPRRAGRLGRPPIRRGTRCAARAPPRPAPPPALAPAGVEQVRAVQRAARRRRTGDSGSGARAAGDVEPGADPARGHLERPRPPVRRPARSPRRRARAAVAGSARGRLDHLGHPGGDVVQAAGEDRDLVAVAVHLHPDAVELLTRPRPGPAGSSAAPSRRRCCASIGCTGRPTSSRKPASAAAPPASAASATGPSVAAQHHRPPHVARPATPGGPGDRVEHHALEGALAQLADEQPRSRKRCSAAVARRTARRAAAAGRLRPGAGLPPIPSKAASTSPTLSVGSAAGAGTSRSDAQPTPIRRCRSSPDRKATARPPRPARPGPAPRPRRDLLGPAAGRRYGLRRGGQVGEQQAGHAARSSRPLSMPSTTIASTRSSSQPRTPSPPDRPLGTPVPFRPGER